MRRSLGAPLSLAPGVLLLLPLLFFFFYGHFADAAGTADGSEEWGYVTVRPKAHMFWWLYRIPQRVDNGSNPWPVVLWLQGGPGASGVGIGNFQEIGPLDTDLKPRNSTWLQKADLLFVDNPVGTGYSYVEDEKALVETDHEAAADLTALLKELFNGDEQLQRCPLYVVAESYGGKYAVTLGLSLVDAIQAGELKLQFGGVALGDSWISPEDFVFSWGPLLKDLSRLDINGLQRANSVAEKIREQIQSGKYAEATGSWRELESVIIRSSNSVDFYNFLLDDDMDPISLKAVELPRSVAMRKYSKYLSSKMASGGGVDILMNGPIKEKLKIIPKNVSWGGQSDLVFGALENDFMKPRIAEVDELLSRGINVTIYNGQVEGHPRLQAPMVDLICATKGTEAWVEKLKWEGVKNLASTERTPLYCGGDGATKAFTKSYENLHFYWILGAGHFVPVDQPCVALKMLSEITQSPAAAAVAPAVAASMQ